MTFRKLALSFAVLFAPWVRAGEIQLPGVLTVRDKTYFGVVYQKHDALKVRFSHEAGAAAVEISDLPLDVRKQFPNDPAAAEALRKIEQQQAKSAEEMRIRREVAAEWEARYAQARQDAKRFTAEVPADIGIELSNVAFGRKKNVDYRDPDGGRVTEIARSRGVQAKVVNKGDAPFIGALRVYFFGKADGRLFCFDGEQIAVNLGVGERMEERFDTAIVERKENLPLKGMAWQEGGSYAGQAAEVVDRAGRRVAFFGSIPALTPAFIDKINTSDTQSAKD